MIWIFCFKDFGTSILFCVLILDGTSKMGSSNVWRVLSKNRYPAIVAIEVDSG